mmetsp:Transcript_22243/g.48635  ORF Transcript_22243/g.48635 Transcript_22243/m.48635 type:complete len:339 (-) Transcript_22243:361-1377(-)
MVDHSGLAREGLGRQICDSRSLRLHPRGRPSLCGSHRRGRGRGRERCTRRRHVGWVPNHGSRHVRCTRLRHNPLLVDHMLLGHWHRCVGRSVFHHRTRWGSVAWPIFHWKWATARVIHLWGMELVRPRHGRLEPRRDKASWMCHAASLARWWRDIRKIDWHLLDSIGQLAAVALWRRIGLLLVLVSASHCWCSAKRRICCDDWWLTSGVCHDCLRNCVRLHRRRPVHFRRFSHALPALCPRLQCQRHNTSWRNAFGDRESQLLPIRSLAMQLCSRRGVIRHYHCKSHRVVLRSLLRSRRRGCLCCLRSIGSSHSQLLLLLLLQKLQQFVQVILGHHVH